MNPMGGVGQQIASDVFELGKSVVKGVVKAAGDIATDPVETLMQGSGANANANSDGKKHESGKSDQNQQQVLKKQAERKRFQEVRDELQSYIQHKKQIDAQVSQEKQQEEMQTKQKKAVERQEKESFLQQLMKNLARGSHGESDRQKE